MTLRKGATFHSPKTPLSPVDDPIFDVRGVPQRSPTCPDTLEELVATSHKHRMLGILDSIDRSFSGEDSNLVTDLASKNSLPVPGFLLDHAAADADSLTVGKACPYGSSKHDVTGSKPPAAPRKHHHASDSGLGSSVDTTSSRDRYNKALRSRKCKHCFSPESNVAHGFHVDTSGRSSVYSGVKARDTAINQSFSTFDVALEAKMLSDFAVIKIRQYIVAPILAENKLKEYHTLIEDLPKRIGDRAITCLRDLEKTLIFLAPVSTDFSKGEDVLAECFVCVQSKARSAASYLNFCEISIQCIHTTVQHLNESDLHRPTDRPYTNNYFLDLTQQVRQYARIMAASRQKQAEGKSLDAMDYTEFVPTSRDDSHWEHDLTRDSGENLRLHGGISQNGRPAELVREKDGKIIPIDDDKTLMSPSVDNDEDDDAERIMARKRKCDIGKIEWRACRECGKEFKRSCDLTKHEKTHSRPWKCPEVGCKYHDFGWPTEKECDRHINDKHSTAPPLYKCLYKGCTYTSKRESNCKQHMEKAHGWEYVRSKSKKGAQNLIPTTQQTPSTPLMPTPQSAKPTLATPQSDFFESPANVSSEAFSPTTSIPAAGSELFGHGNDSNLSIGDGLGGSYEIGGNQGDLLQFGGSSHEFQPNGHPPSPEASEGHRGTFFDTIDFSNIDSNLSPSAWESPLDFNSMDCMPKMDDFFCQYNPIQQPTPAMSDFNFDCNGTAGLPQATAGPSNMQGVNLSPGASGDLMLCDSRDSLQSSNSTNQNSQHHHNNNNDFTLFNEISGHGGDAGNAVSFFPDLPDLVSGGEQFEPGDPMMDTMEDLNGIGPMFPTQQH